MVEFALKAAVLVMVCEVRSRVLGHPTGQLAMQVTVIV
jgi:hypothetical protein